MDADSPSICSDPGLFDAPPQPPPSTAQAPLSSTADGFFDEPLGGSTSRRVYRPVPEEKKRSDEYQSRRERNNKAVQRCRAQTRVKQACLGIKSQGYRELAREYSDAARQMDINRRVRAGSTIDFLMSAWLAHCDPFVH